MSKLDIGFDAKRAFFNNTGLGNYSRNLIKGLAEYFPEHHYHLYSPVRPMEHLGLLQNEHCSLHLPDTASSRAVPAVWRSYTMAEQLQREGIQIYHGLSNELPRNIGGSGVRSVVTIHDLIFLRYPEQYNWVDRRIYENKFNHACRKADVIIATSEQTKQDIVEFFGTDESRIQVVYQCYDPTFEKKLSKTAIQKVLKTHQLPDKYILYVGSFIERKRALELLKAYREMGDKTYDLVLIGNGSTYKKKLQQYIARYKLQKHVHMLDQVSMTDLPAMYQGASLFVYPSVFEGFGIPLVEAMASSIPIVTTKGGVFEEVAQNAAIYADAAKPKLLAEAMGRVLAEKTTRAQLVRNGKSLLEHYSQKSFATNTMKIYERLL